MTPDIVERLRAEVAYDELLPDWSNMTDLERLCDEAADAIEIYALRDGEAKKLQVEYRDLFRTLAAVLITAGEVKVPESLIVGLDSPVVERYSQFPYVVYEGRNDNE